MLENYCKTIIIEANTMVDMARSQIAPAIESYIADVAKAASAKKILDSTIVCNYEMSLVKKLSHLVERIISKVAEIEEIMISLDNAENIGVKSTMIRDFVLPLMGELRLACDEAETLTAKSYWPFPSYAELLFSVK